MGQHLTPTCDVCGTEKNFRRGVGSFCPNVNCGGTHTPETVAFDAPPADGYFVKLTNPSVRVVLEEKLREQPTLQKVEAIELFATLGDGSTRRVSDLMVQVRYPKPDRSPAPSRTTGKSGRHPNGVQLRLASRDGVSL